MKAIVCTKYGSPDYLKFQDVDKPVIKEEEVLVKVFVSNVTRADGMMRNADPFISRFFLGWSKPKQSIMGTGFAGEVVAVGEAVSQFKVGDRVFGETGVKFGANAEYIAINENGVISGMPKEMTYEEAAPLGDGAMTSINFLKNIAQIKAGQKVLINGASGGLGTAAVQIAKYYGAEVTGVSSSRNVDFVKSLGADYVIDYTKEDFTKSEKSYDVVYDAVGKSSYSAAKKVLKKDGIYMSPVLGLKLLIQVIWTSFAASKKAKFSATGLLPTPELRSLLEDLKTIIEEGHLQTVIGKRYPLAEAAAAHHYVDQGHKRGNVVLKVA